MNIVRHTRILVAAIVVVIAGAALLLWLNPGSGRRLSSSGNPGPWTVAQAQAFPDYTVFWLGEEYNGLPLTKVTREIADDNPKLPFSSSKDGFEFQYGTCTIPAGVDACPIPLSVQVQPRCYLPPEILTTRFKKGPLRIVRGGAQLQENMYGGQVDIWTGEVHVRVFAADPYQAAQALRPINRPGAAASPLPAPNKAPCSKIMGRDPSELPLLLTPAARALLTPEVAALLTPVPAAPATPAGNAMALDADASTPAIVDASRTVTGSAPFTVGINVTAATDAYKGYQWEIEYPGSGLAFDGGVSENTVATGLDTCAPSAVNPNATPLTPGDTVYGGGAGCATLRSGITTNYTGQTTTFNMHCLAAGAFSVQLVGAAQDPFFGTSLVAPDGGTLNTATAAITVTCA